MTPKAFRELCQRRYRLSSGVLDVKAEQYSRADDRLHGFRKAAAKRNSTPPKILMDIASKHDIVIDDWIDDYKQGILPTREMLDEVIGDRINYYILLEAIFVDAIEAQEKVQKEEIENLQENVRIINLENGGDDGSDEDL